MYDKILWDAKNMLKEYNEVNPNVEMDQWYARKSDAKKNEISFDIGIIHIRYLSSIFCLVGIFWQSFNLITSSRKGGSVTGYMLSVVMMLRGLYGWSIIIIARQLMCITQLWHH